MNDFVISLVRTYVPIFVGSFVAYLATKGIELDAQTSASLVVFLTGTIIAVYYGVVRLVEKRFPQAGILLGSTKTPEYTENVR